VDEAYQLTQALQRGQSDFSGEAIDEMMKVMNDTGRKATTFVFAGYKKEMDEFVQYNAGLESRIKYRFHFDDYTVPELVTIINIKMQAKGYLMSPDASSNMEYIINSGTDQNLRSKYNGRLTDNLLQWASDEMNNRLKSDATGDALITLVRSDFEVAIKRFKTNQPPTKADPALAGGEAVANAMAEWSLQEYAPLFLRAGYRQIMDLLALREKDIRALGVTKDPDVRKCLSMVDAVEQENTSQMREMDAVFMDDCADIPTWLKMRALSEFEKVFAKHRIDFEVLGDLTYEDLKEMGLSEVGARRKVFRAVEKWRDDRDVKKKEAIRARLQSMQFRIETKAAGVVDVADRLNMLRQSVKRM